MGSKNGIAQWVVSHIPPSAYLYDLFGGGGAISHFALTSGKFRHVHYNDINPLSRCFERAVRGEISDAELYRWVPRSEFRANCYTDHVCAFVWTFGDKVTLKRYLYAVEMEDFKKALHHSRVFNDDSLLRSMGIPTDNRKWLFQHKEEARDIYCQWYMRNRLNSDLPFTELCRQLNEKTEAKTAELQEYLNKALRESGLTAREVGKRLGTNMERHYFGKSQWSFPTEEHYNKMREFMPLPLSYAEVNGIEGFDSLTGLRQLRNLADLKAFYSLENKAKSDRIKALRKLGDHIDRITFSTGSYTDITAEPANSVIYCDIPYRGTCAYNDFDHEAFFDWTERQSALVIISEYDMPKERFTCIASTDKRSLLSADANNAVVERLFVPTAQYGLYRRRMGYLFYN